ncbi:hypothetical protein [Streptomyces sp. NPDC097640]
MPAWLDLPFVIEYIEYIEYPDAPRDHVRDLARRPAGCAEMVG